MRAVILFFLLFNSCPFITYAQNFFPFKTGDKFQFALTRLSTDPYISSSFTSYNKSLISEEVISGKTYFIYKDRKFRYDSSYQKLYTIVNNLEKLAYDFNKQPNQTDTLFITGDAKLFTYKPDWYGYVWGKSRLVKTARWSQPVPPYGFESKEIRIIDSLGIWSVDGWFSIGGGYTTNDLETLISAVIDGTIYNPISLSVSANFPDTISAINYQFPINCLITAPYLKLIDTLKAEIFITNGNNVLFTKNYYIEDPGFSPFPNKTIDVSLPLNLLRPPNMVNIRVICKDESIFENTAYYPDTGYVSIPCQEFPTGFWFSTQVNGIIQNDIINSMKFFNKNNGIIFVDPSNTKICETEDGGISWNRWNGFGYENIKNWQTLDSNYTYGIADHGFFKTSNGGGGHSIAHFGPPKLFNSLSFVDVNLGWLAVDYIESTTNSYPAILKTTNGGESWDDIQVNLSSGINEIDFINENEGWLQTINGNFYKSTDGGNNWSQISYIPQYDKIFMMDNLNGWAIGNGVAKTKDGGYNWEKSISGNYWDAHFFDNNYGWILGRDSLNRSVVFYTKNGGVNWVNRSLGTYEYLFIDFIDKNNGWILCKGGHLLKTIDSGIPPTPEDPDPEEPPYLPSEYLLVQNYPNPFNPSTTISWQTPVSGWQTLKVYDVLGNEVAVLVNEYKNAGSYNVEFGMQNLELSSGVYFYQIRAGDFVETKKMILLK